MERMNAVFTAGCLVLMLGILGFTGSILVPFRTWIEPSLYICAVGAALMALSPCAAFIPWLLGFRR